MLEQALRLKRQLRNTPFEYEANGWIIDIIFETELKHGANPYRAAVPLMDFFDIPLPERVRWNTVYSKIEIVTTTTYTYKN